MAVTFQTFRHVCLDSSSFRFAKRASLARMGLGQRSGLAGDGVGAGVADGTGLGLATGDGEGTGLGLAAGDGLAEGSGDGDALGGVLGEGEETGDALGLGMHSGCWLIVPSARYRTHGGM